MTITIQQKYKELFYHFKKVIKELKEAIQKPGLSKTLKEIYEYELVESEFRLNKLILMHYTFYKDVTSNDS